MITDPEYTEEDIGLNLRGGCFKNPQYHIEQRNSCEEEDKYRFLSFRIVMNITDMNKLMENNRDH